MFIVADVWEPSGRRDFLSLPSQVYAGDPRYCPPLALHVDMMLGRLGEPEKHLLVVYEEGKPVARLGVKRHRHGEYDALHFGFYESLPVGPEPTQALFQVARRRFPHLPLRGPYHFRMEDPYTGIQVDGFDQPPYFFMAYNPPYYDEYLQAAGLKTAMDLFTYEYLPERVNLDMLTAKSKAGRDKGFRVRPVDLSRINAEARLIADIVNDSMAENWGYETVEDDQLQDMVTFIRFFLDHRLVYIAEKGAEAVGCVMVFPNYNPLVRRSQGKVGPRFLFDYFVRRRQLDTFRGYAIGARRAYRDTEVSAMLVDAILQQGKTIPWKATEVSWVLANNRPMNLMAVAAGGRRSKIYRLYEGAPGGTSPAD